MTVATDLLDEVQAVVFPHRRRVTSPSTEQRKRDPDGEDRRNRRPWSVPPIHRSQVHGGERRIHRGKMGTA